ncbi:hypothetical protein [Bacillus kwashiorkori]|uniref:hypothetical protein n=1 Tax=Bacillus kwashiorkori TaxID=1522318 RepID=UPI0007836D3D|nr:hypothetical protein [Bacillus kwashiorkori]
MAVIFVAIWVGLTMPIALSIVFSILKPIVMADNTGIGMIVLGLLIAFLNGYIGIKIFDKKIEPWLDKHKKLRR